MKTNYHTHTKRCCHAGGSEVDYAKAAYESGLDILGFSDHAPFTDRDYGYRMQPCELFDYINAVKEQKQLYKGKMEILAGLEIEYLPKYSEYYDYLLSTAKLDYLALGEHFYKHNAGIKNIFCADSTNDYIDYARAISDALKTGFFAFVAHPDIMFINNFAWDSNCNKACEIIIEAAKSTNTLLEFNANGLRRGVQDFPDGTRCPYPHPTFWRMANEAGVKAVVGSDCHSPSVIYDEFVQQAHELARQWKIDVVDKI